MAGPHPCRPKPVDEDDCRLARYATEVMALSKDIEQAVANLRS